MRLGPHTIVRLRAATKTDGYGTALDWANPAELPIEGCSWQPTTGQESTDGREARVERAVVWAPLDADVSGTDRLRHGSGPDWHVDGEPQAWDYPGLGHLVITVKRSRG